MKHGWIGITNSMDAGEAKLMSDIGLTKFAITLLSIVSLAVAILTVIPSTFFIGNIINATSILVIIAFSLNSGNYKLAFVEIPFLLIPLVLIWLGHPLKS
jgi:hypothetical protein